MNRLRLLRNEKNLTQQQVADALGIERSLYARYEYGSRTPPVDNLIKLSEFFNVTTDYLLELSDEPQGGRVFPPPTTVAAHATEGMEPISQERLDEIIAYAVQRIKQEAAKNMKKGE